NEPFAAYIDIAERLGEYIKIVRTSSVHDMDAMTLIEMERQSIQAQLELRNAASQELHNLLDSRMSADKTGAALTILVIIVFFSIAAYLFIGFYLGVRHAVSLLREASEQLAE